MNKKTKKLKTEKKFTVSLMGRSVPTFLQTLAEKKDVSNPQIIHCLDNYLKEFPEFATEFMNEAKKVSTSRNAKATTPEIEELANQLAIAISKSEKPQQDTSYTRSAIKQQNDKTFGY